MAGARAGVVVMVAATTDGAAMVVDLEVRVRMVEGTSAATTELAAKVVDPQEA